jgi:drug/metabolite transporter (DMT)-like permease
VSKILIALYVLATSLALIFLKLGSGSGAPFAYTNNRFHFNLNWYISSAIILYGTSFLIYTYLISKYDLGYIIPLATAFVYVAIVTASYFIFHEIFTTAKILGIVLIVIGLVLLNLKK